jgi:hypothetical protein
MNMNLLLFTTPLSQTKSFSTPSFSSELGVYTGRSVCGQLGGYWHQTVGKRKNQFCVA